MRKTLFLLLPLAFSFACAKDRVEMLTDRADAYNRSIRWGSLAAAGTCISGDNRRTLLAKLTEEMSKNKVVDYSVVDLSLDEGKKNGTVVVEYSFYNVSTQDLKYRQEVQTWKYESKKTEWFLSDIKSLTGN